jgi:hypothetical protein
MEYIHIRSLEKYHPGYKDRELKWAKVYFTIINGDPEFELIKDETDKWRFLAMICLELQAKKPLPNIEEYWKSKFNTKKRKMSLTIQMLQNFLEVVTEEKKLCSVEKKDREDKEDKNKSKIYVDWEQSTLNTWNSFCDKNPALSKVKEITDTRRKHLKDRFVKDSFKDFGAILRAVSQQPFLLKGNPNSADHKDWKISFDWLIENDTNYIKVLELRYKNKKESDVQGANPDCQICAGTGWDETGEGKRICRCRINR